jgi:hypothetical protein
MNNCVSRFLRGGASPLGRVPRGVLKVENLDRIHVIQNRVTESFGLVRKVGPRVLEDLLEVS